MMRSRFMDTIGDGTGSINASVVGSLGTPVKFIIKPSLGQILYLERIMIFIEDSGSLDSGGFGNGTALTNGVIMRTLRFTGTPEEEIIYDIQSEQLPIKKNQEFKALCHDEIFSNYGAGSQSLSWRYTFTKDTGGQPIPLRDTLKEQMEILIQDDTTTKCDALYFRVGCKSIN